MFSCKLLCEKPRGQYVDDGEYVVLNEYKREKMYEEEQRRMKEQDLIERNSDGERESKVMRKCGIIPDDNDDSANNNWELEVARRGDLEWSSGESESGLHGERKYKWEEKEKYGAREKSREKLRDKSRDKLRSGKANMMALDELERSLSRGLSRKRLEWLWGPLPIPPYLCEYTIGNELVCTPNCPLCNYLNNFSDPDPPVPVEQVKKVKGDHGVQKNRRSSHNNIHHVNQSDSQKENGPTKPSPIKYGELVILGYNSSLPQGDKGRRRSKFALCRRHSANGVKPVKHHVVKNPQQSELIQNSKQHSVSFTLNRVQAIIVQYDPDSETDMFQIGRSSDAPIDFVVMDTVPGAQRAEDCVVTQSTISRFACRILVERNPPFTARIYAAGFDSGSNIFLGEKATKWYSDGEIDGLTTNGVLIMHPNGNFSSDSKPGIWREVSVNGGIYGLRESRSTPQKSSLIEAEDNILRDGTLIDLCGATLLWRSAIGLTTSPSRRELEYQIEAINAGRPQCPVGLNTLVLPSKNTLTESEKQPYVYMLCGHVHGQHGWGKGEDTNTRTCPMCRKNGPFVKLVMGQETSFYVENELPTHCFNPCGHLASEKSVKYWASIPIPHGCHGFQAACPFCATPLQGDPGWVKLVFQDNLD